MTERVKRKDTFHLLVHAPKPMRAKAQLGARNSIQFFMGVAGTQDLGHRPLPSQGRQQEPGLEAEQLGPELVLQYRLQGLKWQLSLHSTS